MYKVEVISIFVENKPGKLEKITEVLAEAGINILGFSITSVKDFGVIKFLVDNPQTAFKLFKEKGFTVALTPALGIEMEDKPGGLYKVVSYISSRGVNIENALVYVKEAREKAYFVFEVENIETALKTLEGESVNFLKMK
jgi:hypothetical protein